MTEVPNVILWIATVCLVVVTLLLAGILISLLALVSKAKQLVNKVQDIATPLKDAAETAGATVSTFSTSLLRPVATMAGAMAGFRKGMGMFGKKRKK